MSTFASLHDEYLEHPPTVFKQTDDLTAKKDGGVVKHIISNGYAECQPVPHQEVTIEYIGRLEDGTIFDKTIKDQPIRYEVGEGNFLKGMDQAIQAMKICEKAHVEIAPKYGYGERGHPGLKVPPNAKLFLTISLIMLGTKRTQDKKDEDMFEEAKKVKDLATEKFKEQNYKEAIDLYMDGVGRVGELKWAKPDQKKLKQICYQNAAICMNKLKTREYWYKAIETATKSLEMDPMSEKSFFARAQAHIQTKGYMEALADLKSLIWMAPNDKSLRAQYADAKQLKIEDDKKFKQNFIGGALQGGLFEDMPGKKDPVFHDTLPEFNPENAQCYFDIRIGNIDIHDHNYKNLPTERIVFEIFTTQVPKTAENFRCLCTGEKGARLHYKNNFFHRVAKGFVVQGGDIARRDGSGSISIYGKEFDDEQIWFPHSHPGVLSMALRGKPNTNGCQFAITLSHANFMNKQYTVFGRIIHNYKYMQVIEEQPVSEERSAPLEQVTIVDCGELTGDQKLSADQCDHLKSYDEEPVISVHAQKVIDERKAKQEVEAKKRAQEAEEKAAQEQNQTTEDAGMKLDGDPPEEAKTEEKVEEVDTQNMDEEINVHEAD